MPYDPDLPAENSGLNSQIMRDQLNALNDKIDAIPAGPPGPQGADGPQGLTGEVSNAQLTSAIVTAIGGTSSNSNAVATLDTPFTNDPPTLADLEAMRAKVNELLLALRRP